MRHRQRTQVSNLKRPDVRSRPVAGARRLTAPPDAGDDTLLVVRAAEGDDDAFAALVQRHAPALIRLATRLLGTLAEAEDAVQDAFLGAWRRLPEFHGQASFGTWMYRIVTNRCLKVLRARRRPGTAVMRCTRTVHPPAARARARGLRRRAGATGSGPAPTGRPASAAAGPDEAAGTTCAGRPSRDRTAAVGTPNTSATCPGRAVAAARRGGHGPPRPGAAHGPTLRRPLRQGTPAGRPALRSASSSRSPVPR